jgi:hypothetical protein
VAVCWKATVTDAFMMLYDAAQRRFTGEYKQCSKMLIKA